MPGEHDRRRWNRLKLDAGTVGGKTVAQIITEAGSSNTDADAIHDNIAGEIVVLTLVAAASGDHFIGEDASDSNQKKRFTAQSIADLGAGGGGSISLVHVTTTSTIAAGDHIVSVETAAVTVTNHSAPAEGESHIVKNISPGSVTLASGTAGNFIRDNVTATSYTLEAEAKVGYTWDGDHYVVLGMSGVIT